MLLHLRVGIAALEVVGVRRRRSGQRRGIVRRARRACAAGSDHADQQHQGKPGSSPRRDERFARAVPVVSHAISGTPVAPRSIDDADPRAPVAARLPRQEVPNGESHAEATAERTGAARVPPTDQPTSQERWRDASRVELTYTAFSRLFLSASTRFTTLCGRRAFGVASMALRSVSVSTRSRCRRRERNRGSRSSE